MIDPPAAAATAKPRTREVILLSILASLLVAAGSAFLSEWSSAHLPHLAAELRRAPEANAA